MSTNTLTLVAVLLLASSSNAWAIYQCRDANGTVSFQDRPCTATQKAEREISMPSDKNMAGSSAVEVTVPSIGAVRVSVPSGWRYEVGNNDGTVPPTLLLTTSGDGGRVELRATLMPDASGQLDTAQGIDSALMASSAPFAAESAEGKTVIRRLDSSNGIGAYANFSEKVAPPKPKFAHVTSGLFNAKGLVCTFTLLADDLTSDSHRAALNVVSRGIVAKAPK